MIPDLAAALATKTDIQVPLPPSALDISDRELGTDPFGPVFHYAHQPLRLCAKAVEFTQNEDPLPLFPPLQVWMEMVEELENWYQERPEGFQPILELDMGNQNDAPGPSFPVVLFANGAGVFSNQLYHTAMLILLLSRPRTARTTGFPSATTSPLWHAQRVCSIALNNDRRECWDPCLLSSFLMAARRMTHETQQQEIISGFDRIQKVTGWNTSELLRGLQEHWQFFEK